MLVENHLKQNNERHLRYTVKTGLLITQNQIVLFLFQTVKHNHSQQGYRLHLLRTHRIMLSAPVTTTSHSDTSSVWVAKQRELWVMPCLSINKPSVRTYYIDPLQDGMATHSIFLPGESPGQRSLVCKESDTTEQLSTEQHRQEIVGITGKL